MPNNKVHDKGGGKDDSTQYLVAKLKGLCQEEGEEKSVINLNHKWFEQDAGQAVLWAKLALQWKQISLGEIFEVTRSYVNHEDGRK